MRKIKVLGLILSFTMLLSIPAMASDRDKQLEVRDGVVICDCGIPYQDHIDSIKELKEIEPRAIECQCGAVMNVYNTSYGNWYRTTTSRECIHTAYGHDYLWKRIVIVRYKCSSCQLDFESPSYDTEWRCGEQ